MSALSPASPPPSVGRIVHYVSYGTPGGEYTQQCRSAMVTEVGAWVDEEITALGEGHRSVVQRWDPMAAALHVMNPTGQFDNIRVPFAVASDTDPRSPMCGHGCFPGGTWHWPVLT